MSDSDAPPTEAPLRLRRAEKILRQRCGNICVVLEKTCDAHNIDAVVRTVESLGIQNVMMVEPKYVKGLEVHQMTVSDKTDAPDTSPVQEIVALLHQKLKSLKSGSASYDIENIKPKGCGDLWRATCTLQDGTTVVGRPSKSKKQSLRLAASACMMLLDKDYREPKTTKPIKAPEESKRPTTHISKGADRWLTIRRYPTSIECVKALLSENWSIWSTALCETAIPLDKTTPKDIIPEKIAIVIGSEAFGVSPEFIAASERVVYLPMYGFTESLNLSVASAMVIQKILDLKENVRGTLSPSDALAIRKSWWDNLTSTPTSKSVLSSFFEKFTSLEGVEVEETLDLRQGRSETQRHKVINSPHASQRLLAAQAASKGEIITSQTSTLRDSLILAAGVLLGAATVKALSN